MIVSTGTVGGVLDGGVLDGGVLDGGVLDGGVLDGGVLDGAPGVPGAGGACPTGPAPHLDRWNLLACDAGTDALREAWWTSAQRRL
ncbi:MAG: hypothetical protein ABSG95_06340 [Solirubrobacteraceae bacterium]